MRRRSRWWRRCTALRSAAGSRSRSPATPASWRRMARVGLPESPRRADPRRRRHAAAAAAGRRDGGARDGHHRPPRAGGRGAEARAGGRDRDRHAAGRRRAARGRWRMAGRCRGCATAPCRPAICAAFDAAVGGGASARARGALAPVRAAEAVGWALDLPFDEALGARAGGGRSNCAPGRNRRALRHLFHAERVAARMPDGGRAACAKAWPVQHAGVVGGGTMGSGIAIALADAGLDVTLVGGHAPTRRAPPRARVRTVYDRQVQERPPRRRRPRRSGWAASASAPTSGGSPTPRS